MYRALTLAFWSFAQIFLFCEASQIVSNCFDDVDFYNQCDWYRFSPRVQLAIPMIIVNTTQHSVVIKAFGNILCTRETFKRVSFENSELTRVISRGDLFIVRYSLLKLIHFRWQMEDFLTSCYFDNL